MQYGARDSVQVHGAENGLRAALSSIYAVPCMHAVTLRQSRARPRDVTRRPGSQFAITVI